MTIQAQNTYANNVIGGNALVRDANNNSVQIASSFQTVTGGQPLTSPLDFDLGQVLNVPPNAVEFIFYSNHPMIISELDNSQYYSIPANEIHVLNCSRMQQIYIEAVPSAKSTLNFYFNII